MNSKNIRVAFSLRQCQNVFEKFCFCVENVAFLVLRFLIDFWTTDEWADPKLNNKMY